MGILSKQKVLCSRAERIKGHFQLSKKPSKANEMVCVFSKKQWLNTMTLKSLNNYARFSPWKIPNLERQRFAMSFYLDFAMRIKQHSPILESFSRVEAIIL